MKELTVGQEWHPTESDVEEMQMQAVLDEVHQVLDFTQETLVWYKYYQRPITEEHLERIEKDLQKLLKSFS